ncbi:MAG: TrkA family potassium uptake protein [Bacteroidetes bacterium]|nr:MAG: TrkA family potassium uptake protein [Bacteroidota bacterium]
MSHKFAIIGLGSFGLSVAKNLAQRGAEVLAIDQNEEIIERIKDEVAYAITMDSTDIKALTSQNIAEMDAVLVAIGENTEGLLFTTILLLELKAKRILARVVTHQQRLILQRLGIEEIVAPEDMVGMITAERLINPNMNSSMALPDEHHIVELKAPRKIFKKTVGEMNFLESYDLDLIAIKRQYDEYFEGKKKTIEHLIKSPSPDIIIESSDILIMLGRIDDTNKFVEINS